MKLHEISVKYVRFAKMRADINGQIKGRDTFFAT